MKTREEVKETLYRVADGLKRIADKYANGEYNDTKDFVPLATDFNSVMDNLLNPSLNNLFSRLHTD